MKKRQIQCLFLGVFMVTSSILGVACKKETETEGVKEKRIAYTNGIHQYIYTETEQYIVKEGKSDYRIVLADDASGVEQTAAKELQSLFAEATGVNLPIVSDKVVYFDFDAKLISVGKNDVWEEVGLSTAGLALDKQGYTVQTVHNSIFITGDDEYGTLFGVYGFLELQFNFDCFSNTTYYIDTNVKNCTLRNYDVVDIPDLKIRNCGNSFITNDSITQGRMRYTSRSEMTFVGSSSAHTTLEYYIFPDVYNDPQKTETYHPKWFSTDGEQLCYLARGDESERAKLLDTAFEGMKTEFINNLEGNIFIFSQMDEYVWCECDACLANLETYGAESASVVKFCNDLANKMETWMLTDEGKPYARDFMVTFLAYGYTVNAPVREGKATIKCADNVAVMFAPIEMDYQHSLYDDCNDNFYQAFEGWKKVSTRFNIYTYQSNYNYFLVPFDCFNQMQDFYTYAATANTYWFFDLGQRGQSASATGWQIFKNYLSSKLAWNVNLDVETLTDKFFTYYYGDASEEMRAYYDSYRIHSKWMIENAGMQQRNSVYGTLPQEKYWPKSLLDTWYNHIQNALERIEYLKGTDITAYQQLYDNITTERVAVSYLMVKLYETRYAIDFMTKVKTDCRIDCERLGIDVMAEGSSINDLWLTWGIE